MEPITWQCDDYGTQNLRPEVNGHTGHVWLQGRRPYCDRGHWEWGYEGLPIRSEDLPSPSYYFMRKDHLMAEAEEWVARATGAIGSGRSIQDLPDAQAMTAGASAQVGSVWSKFDNTTLMAQINHQQSGTFLATIREAHTSTGSVFIFNVDGLEVDTSDCFPRAYFDLDRAMAEAEEFFAWRLLKIPAEIPGPLQEPDQAVGERLAQALQVKPNKPKRRNP